MRSTITSAGHLEIAIEDNADRELVQELLDRHGGNDVRFLAEFLENTGWQPNGQFYQVYPENVGALTDSPLISDELVLDDGEVSEVGTVWWYPDYAVKHFGVELLKHGTVVFTREPKDDTAK